MDSIIIVIVVAVLLVASISWMVKTKRKNMAHEAEAEKNMEKDRNHQRPPMP
ncbi:hypothetical protein GCM10007216_34970 [Thalassobacillus devorans]|uniref:Uncharacterized protein n=1 Tax=Thalassobacillus devorans TaxID=279813 RepID=A0ABQ1PQA4_9BACI|nr:hypothetical protein [Thalassobacillus devorans]NIK30313.1 flagellar basal body-associated protein FliL [Thalassobacillus devorans]GGD01260.1 hypothetical protein GCM10007216_34970 [Thalassobacillus devorans]